MFLFRPDQDWTWVRHSTRWPFRTPLPYFPNLALASTEFKVCLHLPLPDKIAVVTKFVNSPGFCQLKIWLTKSSCLLCGRVSGLAWNSLCMLVCVPDAIERDLQSSGPGVAKVLHFLKGRVNHSRTLCRGGPGAKVGATYWEVTMEGSGSFQC